MLSNNNTFNKAKRIWFVQACNKKNNVYYKKLSCVLLEICNLIGSPNVFYPLQENDHMQIALQVVAFLDFWLKSMSNCPLGFGR